MRGLNLVPVCPLLDRQQLFIAQQCRLRPEINEEQRKLAHNAKCVKKNTWKDGEDTRSKQVSGNNEENKQVRAWKVSRQGHEQKKCSIHH